VGCLGAVVVGLASLIALTGACSQPRLESMARELARSVPRAEDATVGGSIGLRFVELDVKGAETQAPRFPIGVASFVAQPGARRHALVGPAGRVALTDHRVLYARRELNGPADHRPWVRLEIERLEEVDVPRLESLINQQDIGMLAVISPGFVLDTLHGVLTGSVKRKQLDHGRRRYDFNISVDKAERELDISEDERDDLELLRRSVALTSDIFKASAILRRDGSLAELTLHLVQRPDKRTAVGIDVLVNVDPPSTTSQRLWPPKRDHSIRVSSLAALRGSLVDQLGPKEPITRGTISIDLRSDEQRGGQR
jgi:hypothetical protein